MEEAVAALRDTVRLALAQAQRPGDEARPHALLADVGVDSEPIPALATDRGHSYFASARRDIGFLEALRTTKKPPSAEERSRLAAMLRWAIRELNEWRLEDDTRRQRLVALLVLTRCCNPDGDFWARFPPGLEHNANLLAELGRLIAGWRIDLAMPGYSRNPISEGEAIERFRVADAAGDWATIANEWRQYESFVLLSQHPFYLEAIPCLQRFAYPLLLGSLSGIRQIILVVQFLSALTVRQSLALALDSNNPYVRFGAALASLPQNRRVSLDGAEEALLSDLLVKVASDPDQWSRWMLAFNRFPMYYPAIQVSLGKALAAIPQSCLASYANAVVLTTLGGSGREAVATCLREFRLAAKLERRQELWRRAYECWSKWNFDSATTHQSLYQVSFSELDYAVVGYALECLSAEGRARQINDAVSKCSAVATAWHASHKAFSSECYRQLALLQPFAYAEKASTTSDWLMHGNENILPFDPRVDRYQAMLYKIASN